MWRHSSRLSPTIMVFLGLAAIFLMVSGRHAFGRDKPALLTEAENMATPHAIKASAKAAIPPIDAVAPAKTETATFALG